MVTISSVRISGFRSIRSLHIEHLGDFTVLAGLNNSGKSNVLRALNLFFNGEVEPGRPLDLGNDFHAPSKKKKLKQRIRVDVAFTLPSQFRFRQSLGGVEQALGGRQFSIGKEWTFGTAGPAVYLNRSVASLSDAQSRLIQQFLDLVHFRYIPNRVLPVEIVRAESTNLQALLQRRLSLSRESSQDVFNRLGEVAQNVFQNVAREVTRRVPQISSVSLKTPDSLAEVLLGFALNVVDDGGELADEMQGSGLQSFLMLTMLHLIDTDFGGSFGWRQSAVWAVEEPESSMHFGLERQTASFLRHVSQAESSRLQIISTTHSEAMMQFATTHAFVTKENGETRADICGLASLVERGALTGISRGVHPLLLCPHKPLLLVEGKFDQRVISVCLQFLGYRSRIEVETLASLGEGGGAGGHPNMKQYLDRNIPVLRQRQPSSPVVVVLDWESHGSRSQYEQIGSRKSVPVKGVAWDASLANPNLSERFKGIERFHGDRLIRLAIERGAQISTLPRNNRWSVHPHDYESVKQILDGLVQQEFLASDMEYMTANILRFVRECGLDTPLFV